MTTFVRHGALYVPASAVPPPPPPAPVGECSRCHAPMHDTDRPFLGGKGPTGWWRRYWVCKCSECYECPACWAKENRPHGCPTCGEGFEYT